MDNRSLINEVLDLSKIEAGKMELESVAFDLRVELDDVLCLFEDKVHNKQLEVLALVHDAVPKIVFGDNGRFRQVNKTMTTLNFVTFAKKRVTT